MENKMIKITTNAIKADGKTFAVARIAGFNCIQTLVWDEKDATAVGVKIANNPDGTYTQETMKDLQGGYFAHLRKCEVTLKSMIASAPYTLVVKPFQAGPLAYALKELGAEVEIDTESQPQPQSTNVNNKLPMIGCGRVKGKFKGGVSDYKQGRMASAILLPYEGYNFDPKNDPCWEVQGFVGVNNKVKLGFFIFVAAKTKDAAKNMIRSWIDREVGKDAKVYTDHELCNKLGLYKNFGIYGCFQLVKSKKSREFLNMAFECEHLDGPQFVFAKETIDMNSTADIMALIQSQTAEIAALKAENSELKTRLDNLEKQLAQLQVLLMTSGNNGNISSDIVNNSNNGSDDSNNGSNNTAAPFDFEEVNDTTLEDEPQPESDSKTEPAPEQPAAAPEPEQPEVATAVTEEEIKAVNEFVSFENEKIQEDELVETTADEKQKAGIAIQAKVQRALAAVTVLGSTTKSFARLVKAARRNNVINTIYDIKVDNGEVFIKQGMFVENWDKISIENKKLVVTIC